MKLSDPRVWLSFVSLSVVVALFIIESERTSPGPISKTHAQESDLESKSGCSACHGSMLAGMASACSTCHEDVARAIEGRTGLHGNITGLDANECAKCHSEHHGREFALVSAKSFALAGIADRARFDHANLGFELAGAHADLECARCHANADVELLEKGSVRFLGLSQDCKSCHDDPHQGRMSRACADCHGQERPFKELANFEHGDVFALVGAHARASCYQCHLPDSAHSIESLAGGEPPSSARRCADCHASPHTPQFTAAVAAATAVAPEASCSSCHEPSRETFRGADVVMPAALHAASGFALDAPHDRAQCSECHAPAPGAPVAFSVQSPARSPDACASCHADPHGGQFADGAFGGGDCLACHERRSFQPPRFDVSAHERTRFPLTGSHREAECNACHVVDRDHPTAPRAFRGTSQACESCHADAHAGAFTAASARDGRTGCAVCHVTTRFSEVAAQDFDHARWTGFPLDGAHARESCGSCHVRAEQPDALGRAFGRVADIFPGPVGACASCHADVHGGAFDRPGTPLQVAGRSGCARCHSTASFRGVAPGDFDHATWTGFVLTGAHARAECTTCHAPLVTAEGKERRLGPVAARFPGPIERCDTCHTDPHAGAFDGRNAPALVDGRVSCARCHTTDAFRMSEAPNFDHELWTGFALEGAHENTACVACHPRLSEQESQGKSWASAAGTDCAACHADPHAGQFSAAGRTDCARCHLDGPTFAELAFDHQRDSRFVLDATHADLDCAACHVAWQLKSGAKVIRYKPLGTTCVECHGTTGGGMAAGSKDRAAARSGGRAR